MFLFTLAMNKWEFYLQFLCRNCARSFSVIYSLFVWSFEAVTQIEFYSFVLCFFFSLLKSIYKHYIQMDVCCRVASTIELCPLHGDYWKQIEHCGLWIGCGCHMAQVDLWLCIPFCFQLKYLILSVNPINSINQCWEAVI